MRKILPIIIILALLAAGAIGLMWRGLGNEPEWSPGQPIDKEALKIGVIHITDPENETSGYSYAHEIGIKEMLREIGLRDDQIIRRINIQDSDFAASEHAIRECIAVGANVIIATSWWYMDVCEKLAGEFPNVIFAHASGYKSNNTNFTNYFGRIYQARYLGGVVAGLRTGTNKIGYVAAMGRDNSEVTGGLDAFAIGVESVNPEARIYVRVLKRWYDPTGEMGAARSLIEEGCDVITQHCDTPNPQIEAQKAGAWGVGYNSDMSKDAPDATVVSVIWNWGVYYTRLVRDIIDGEFTTKPYFGGMSDGIIGITPMNERLLPPGVAETVESARKSIEDGSLAIFEGVMETNDGNTIGADGWRMPDEEITAGINWYYRNIIEP